MIKEITALFLISVATVTGVMVVMAIVGGFVVGLTQAAIFLLGLL